MLSEELEKTLQKALDKALLCKHQFVTLEHLLFALLEDSDANNVFDACRVNLGNLKDDLDKFLKNNLSDLVLDGKFDPKPTLGFQRVIQRAVIHVQSSGRKKASGQNILAALFSERESHAVYFLQKQNLTRLDVINFISHGIKKENNVDENQDDVYFTNSDDEESDLNENKGKPNFIEKYCINLNKKAELKKIDPVIGRKNESHGAGK